MVGKDQPSVHNVHFIPDRKDAEVDHGATILDAALRAGIAIDAVCGGDGKCGRCKVRPVGKFSASTSDLLTDEETRSGIVLACRTEVEGDLTVEVLPRSRIGMHQILTSSIAEVPRPVTPWTRKESVQLPPATIWDNVADLERLWRIFGQSDIPIPLESLKMLPDAIRTGNWNVTVTLSKVDSKDEITRVEPGNTKERHYGMAVDIGTTTIVAELVDLISGDVVGTGSDYNRQISRGEDVIARMMYSEDGGGVELRTLVTETINSLISRLVQGESASCGCQMSGEDIVAASIAGNTVMTHLFLGLPTKQLRLEPYVPAAHHTGYLKASEVGLHVNPSARVMLFPCRAGYVGGDVIADVLASGLHKSSKLSLLIDVGTNGEIVLGKNDWMGACSCSAGPAFEGGEVSSGMRAMEGAIDRIRINDDLSTSYHVLGGERPVGVCGSGLIDLVAEMYDHGIIDRKARIQNIASKRIRPSEGGMEYVVEMKENLSEGALHDITVTDADLQNLLRTKAAIYGACSTLMRKMSESWERVSSIIIAGGFGYHLDIGRAVMIGMFPDVPQEKYRFIGNGALGGARLALLSEEKRREMMRIFDKMTYFELSVDNDFYNEFASSLFIPHTDLGRFPSASKEKRSEAEVEG